MDLRVHSSVYYIDRSAWTGQQYITTAQLMHDTGKFGHTVMFIARFVFTVPTFSLAVSTEIKQIS